MPTRQTPSPQVATARVEQPDRTAASIPASRTRRAAAGLLNGAVNATAGVLLIGSAASNINGPTPGAGAVAGLTAIGFAVLVYRLNVTSVTKHAGKPGHRICRIRIINTDGDDITLWQAQTRAGLELLIAFTVLGALPVAVANIWFVLFTPNRRRIVDRVARTIVTQAPATSQPARNQ